MSLKALSHNLPRKGCEKLSSALFCHWAEERLGPKLCSWGGAFLKLGLRKGIGY